MQDNILVSVVCTTYNQSKYIRQCLDSLLMQKTNFAYEIIVHDDASTDGTADIVREYERNNLNIIAICEKENQFSKHVPFFRKYILPMVRGKYIATCEGDDFWTDKEKLQIQADFLEENSDYVMCTHAAYYANENGMLNNKKTFSVFTKDKEITTEELIEKWCFATNSRMFRTNIYPIEKPSFIGKCRNGDFVHAVYFSLQGKIYYMNRIMSAYRVNSKGSLSRLYINNRKANIRQNELFVEMLEQLDEYTNYRFHGSVEKHKEKRLFEMYKTKGDLKNARKIKSQYNKLSLFKKFKFFIRTMLYKIDNLC